MSKVTMKSVEHWSQRLWGAAQPVALILLGGFCVAANAQGLSVGESGQASYSQAISVPAGIAGMAPQLGLLYSSGGVNGPVGYGWSVQGLSSITRCSASRATDGVRGAVRFDSSDKLCLDGQRLIQVDSAGVERPFPQTGDAAGVGASPQYREYRTEKDSYARIRAYGYASGSDANSGPGYFKVWTKAGQVYEYGAPPAPSADANTKALIFAQGKTIAMAWAVARISDTVGNFIDFKYEVRDTAWGSGVSSTSPRKGVEWNIAEIQYSDSKVIFSYEDRPLTEQINGVAVKLSPQDAAETYHQGSKNVSLRRLKAVSTYVKSPNTGTLGPATGAVAVKTLVLSYSNGPISKRSLVQSIKECTGGWPQTASSKCLPASTFEYASGGAIERVEASKFNLKNVKLSSLDGSYGVLTADFNGDGRTDLLRWSSNPAENEMYLSQGDGSFLAMPKGSGSQQFNLNSQLFSLNGCVSSMVVDANSDGLPDLVRIFNAKQNDGSTCNQTPRAEYLFNTGAGQFTVSPIQASGSAPEISFERLNSNVVRVPFCQGSDEQYRKSASKGGASSFNAFGAQIIDARGVAPQSPQALSCANNTPMAWGFGWTAGATYYFVDLDGDGLLDIVTTRHDFKPAVNPFNDPGDEACPGCQTRIYMASRAAGGGIKYSLQTSALDQVSVYSSPGTSGGLQSSRALQDLNGDGIADLSKVGPPRFQKNWVYTGEPNKLFAESAGAQDCTVSLDANGDGRADCLSPSSIAANNALQISTGQSYETTGTFNLKNAGQELDSNYDTQVGSRVGVMAFDVNNDGRQDLLRLGDDPARNAIYLSNGDGSFTQVFNLGAWGSTNWRKSDGSYDVILGDFSGTGNTEFLRVSTDAATNASRPNQLWNYSIPSLPADLITSYTGSNQLRTVLNYELSTNASGVYQSDRGTSNAATYPKVDLTVPNWLIARSLVEVGIGSKSQTVRYNYTGLKADATGRGLLGFRQVERTTHDPDDTTVAGGRAVLRTTTEYLQDAPYIGVAANTVTRHVPTGNLLSKTVNFYCHTDASNAALDALDAALNAASTAPLSAAPPAAGTVACSGVGKVARPYLLGSIETAADLAGYALPSVTTRNTYSNRGDLKRVVSTTRGVMTSSGVSQTFTKTVDNSYKPDDTSCNSNESTCRWILGRLERASASNTVPESLPQLSTSPGTSPLASATVGTKPGGLPPKPLDPAVLSAILQLLLED